VSASKPTPRSGERQQADPPPPHVFSEYINRAEPVSRALGHHLMEGRWLHDMRLHDHYDDVRWWLRSNAGTPHARLRRRRGR